MREGVTEDYMNDLQMAMDPCRFCGEKMVISETFENNWYAQCSEFGKGRCQVTIGPFLSAEDAVLRWNGV